MKGYSELEACSSPRTAASGLLDREWDVVVYLRPHGITSEAGRQWLTSLAQGPLSVEKYSAVEALVTLNGTPPASLLPQVMELIRSPEYFCAPNLVLSLEKFGRHATRYIDELVELRAKLEIEAKLPVDYRTVVLRTDFAAAASEMDRAIAALQE